MRGPSTNIQCCFENEVQPLNLAQSKQVIHFNLKNRMGIILGTISIIPIPVAREFYDRTWLLTGNNRIPDAIHPIQLDSRI
jgi:hypothetical protein